MKTIEILPYEILDAFQAFLLQSTDFETYLNTLGYTNNASETLTRINYIHYPDSAVAIKTFPFISFESLDTLDQRSKQDGFSWSINILLGIKDKTDTLAEGETLTAEDYENTINENVKKYTKTRIAQDFCKKIIEAITDEMEISGIKGNFEIEFSKIATSTTSTGEYDPMYGGIELDLISYKEI